MRRLFKRSSITALSLALLLAACGSDDPVEPADTGDTEEPADTEDPEDDGAGEDDGADDEPAASGDFDPETYFAGQTIRFVTSSGPGGGTDTKIRTLASQLQRFIPGEPATQVSNVTPHVAGINYMANAEPDGLTVFLGSAPTLEFEFFEGAQWDSSEFEYIATFDNACGETLMVRGDLGYESIEDASGADEPALITMTSAPTPADVEPVQLSVMLIADYLGLPLEIRRVAESGSAALILAIERGEINTARFGTFWCRLPESNPGWLEDGFLIPMLDLNVTGPAAAMAPGVEDRGERPPHVSEVLDEDQYEEWRGLVAASRAGGSPFLLPPGTPAEIRDAWRDILTEAMADEDFVENLVVGFGGSDLNVIPGEEAAALFTENLEIMTRFDDQRLATTEELVAKYVN